MLFEDDWAELLHEFLLAIPFFITTDVEKELKHFHPNSESVWRSGAYFPRRGKTFDLYDRSVFDAADVSLLEYAESSEHMIITEDGPMLAENVTSRNNIMQLVDLFRRYYETEFFTSREYYNLIKWFRGNSNITKKKEKFLLKKFRHTGV